MNIWIVLIICLTIFCCVSEVSDALKEKYKNEKENNKITKNKNSKIDIENNY